VEHQSTRTPPHQQRLRLHGGGQGGRQGVRAGEQEDKAGLGGHGTLMDQGSPAVPKSE